MAEKNNEKFLSTFNRIQINREHIFTNILILFLFFFYYFKSAFYQLSFLIFRDFIRFIDA